MTNDFSDTQMDSDGSSYLGSDSFDSLLFYTPKLTQLVDDNEILSFIQSAFPKLNGRNSEKEDRKSFLEFLSDKDLVEAILERYNYKIVDLMQLFIRRHIHLFNSKLFIGKIKDIIERNGYS